MRTSENIADLAQALSKFQGEVKDAVKDTEGHNYKYADLAQVLQLCRPLLAKHGLAVAQLPFNPEIDQVGVTTRLMHTSGEWMESDLAMLIQPGRMSMAQGAGTVITYCRRYALASILGITQQDNDGATEVEEPKPEPKKATEKQIVKLQEYADAGQIPDDILAFLEKRKWALTQAEATRLLKKLKGLTDADS